MAARGRGFQVDASAFASDGGSTDSNGQGAVGPAVGAGAGAGGGAGAGAAAASAGAGAGAAPAGAVTASKPAPQKATGGISDALIVRNTPTEKKRGESSKRFLQRITHLNLMGKKIQQITNLLQCYKLRVLYLYDNQIAEIANLPATLEQLHLQNNKVRRMENLGHLKHLTKLFLDHNEIAKVEGLEACKQLEELRVSHQRLPKGTELTFDYASLEAIGNTIRVLKCSHNRVSTIVPLALLGGLSSADLSHNNLSDMSQVEPFLKYTPFLQKVDFRGNAITKPRKYRDQIVLASRSVAELDGKKVEKNQREYLHRLAAQKKSRPTKAQKARADAEAAASKDALSAGLPKRKAKYAPTAKLGSKPGARAVGAGGFMAAPRKPGQGGRGRGRGSGLSGARFGRR